jgi:hypothetical protein
MNEKLAAAQISGGFERIYNKTKGWEITGLYHFCVITCNPDWPINSSKLSKIKFNLK